MGGLKSPGVAKASPQSLAKASPQKAGKVSTGTLQPWMEAMPFKFFDKNCELFTLKIVNWKVAIQPLVEREV